MTVTAAEPSLPQDLTGSVDVLRLRVEGLSALLALTADCPGRLAVSMLTLEVAPWRIGSRELAMRVDHVPGLLQHSVRRTKGKLTVTLRMKEPVDLARLLVASLPLTTPVARRRRGSGRPDLALFAPATAVAPFVSIADRLVDAAALEGEDVRPTDVLVVAPDVRPPAPTQFGSVVVAGTDASACVDPAIHRPVGRSDFTLPTLVGRFTDDRVFEAIAPDGMVLRPAGRHGITDLGVASLLPYAGVRFDQAPEGAAQVRVLSQLSGSGLVVSAPASRYGAESATELVRSWADPVPSSDQEREVASVRQRRAAHRDHSTLRLGAESPVLGVPTLSVILCSNRPDRLEAALCGLTGLDYPQLQVVLGLHGIAAPIGLDEWLVPLRAHADVIVREFGSEVVFGAALADLSVHADGDLLTKVDDDDHYGPEHLWDLVVAHEYSGAAVVGKLAEFVHLTESDVTVRRGLAAPERYGRTVAGGTMLISQADLRSVGGWRPVPRSVDRALLDRVVLAGAGVYRTHALGYVYVRHQDGHTWQTPEDYFTTDVRGEWEGLVVPGSR